MKILSHARAIAFALFAVASMPQAVADPGVAPATSPDIWLEQKTTASDGGVGSLFGTALWIDGANAIVGAEGDQASRGALYAFAKTDGIWSEGQKILADDGASGDQFGYGVAVENDSLLVSAYSATINGQTAQGAAYAFTKTDGTWIQTQKLLADDGAVFDDFGATIALDGDTAVIGANGAAIGDSAQGAAYVFTRADDEWTQQAKLIADDGIPYANFGFAAAIRGSTAFVSAVVDTIDGAYGQGSVYVFVESDGVWTQTQKLIASDGAGNDRFGENLDFDGTTLIVGAPGHGGSGAVYVFEQAKGSWVQGAQLTADDGASGDYFGNRVARHGSSLLIGADIATIDGNTSRGAAYLFTETAGVWNQTRKFVASDGDTDNFFGSDIAFDGDTAVISAPNAVVDGNSFEGATYFYSKDTLLADGFDG